VDEYEYRDGIEEEGCHHHELFLAMQRQVLSPDLARYLLRALFYHIEANPLRHNVSSKARHAHVSDISVSSGLARPCSFRRASISSAVQRWW
jgi:hypothetical protein